MRTELLPHNTEAYGKVIASMEQNQRTCVIHPTGTGKSYLLGAVSEAYKKVLVLCPNVYVLNQVRNVLSWRKKGIEYKTYASLMYQDEKPTGYDLICLDEFHRTGAPEWGNAVKDLLDANSQAKVFGTTATNVRYLDGERDMAQELFHGNVASRITIAEAWSKGILPIPRYVSGLFRWDKPIADATERISNSRRLTKAEKRERIFRLSNAHLNWDLSYGMPAILRNHLDSDARRVIVFCSSIETLEQMRRKVEVWFREAGFVVAGSYIVHSDMTESEQREQMEQFEGDEGEGVKLMFSVNMLNEGIHVPQVSAVIMLRITSSRIIYLQQMGRCLTAANTSNPLVLDMVDNITTTTVVHDIAIEYNNIEREEAEKQHRKPRTFEVIDYTLGVKDLIAKLVPEEYSFISDEELLEIVTAFCEEHGRFPSRNDKDKHTYRHYITLRKNLKGDPRLQALDDKYCEYKDFDVRLARLVKFVEENGRVPDIDDKQEFLNYKVLRRQNREKKLNNPVLIDIIKKYAVVADNDIVKQMLLDFYEKHGRMPRKGCQIYEERRLYNMYAHRREVFKKDEDIQRIVLKRRTLEEKIELMQKFIAQHHRKPFMREKTAYSIWDNLLKCCGDNPEVQRLIDETDVSPKKMTRYIAPLVEFVDREHRAPKATRGKEEKHLYDVMAHLRDNYSDNPLVVELLKKIDDYAKQQEEVYIKESVAKVYAFVDENGFLPSGADPKNRNIRDLFNYLRRTRGNHPLVAEMVIKYTKQ